MGENLAKNLADLIGFGLALFAIYTAGFGQFEPSYHRGLSMGAAVFMIVLLNPLSARIRHPLPGGRLFLWLVDGVLVLIFSIGIFKLITIADALWTGIYDFTQFDLISSLLAVCVILELSRRAIGLPLSLIAGAALIYAAFGKQLPWIFNHVGFTLEQIMQGMWYSLDGVFGLPTAVLVNIIFVYIVFGAILEGSGAGAVLLKLAISVTGRLRGGPAHAAIVASGLFGTMSGSAVANVVGTGVFTIPMIKKRGFTATFAGAVETAASSGGQIMPPIMGAAAFLLAELTGTAYLNVAIAALVPALFFYGALFAAVSVEAARLGIEPIPLAERERMTAEDWRLSLMFIVPLVVLIGVLISGRTAAGAGFWATISAIGVPFLVNPAVRADPKRLVKSLVSGGLAGARIMMAVAAIGVLLAVLNMTGLGIRFSNVILELGEGNLLLSLFYTMIGALILGMGLPTLPAYLIIVLVMGPALADLGIPVLVAHMFVFYFGVLSVVTPPVALAAYAAAPIAGSRPLATGVTAVRLAFVGFVIPYIFAFHPSLLLIVEFDAADFAWVSVRLIVAIWMLTTALAGFEQAPLTQWMRGLRLILGAALLYPLIWVQIAACAIALAAVAFERLKARAK